MRRKEHVDNQKHCASCDAWHPLTAFHQKAKNWDGLHAYCRPCMQAKARARYEQHRPRLLEDARRWRVANPEKRKAIALRFKFGLEVEAYNAMLSEQNGRCAICRRAAPLHVDHCHKTNRVRGLLCMPCNTAIGAFADDPDRLRAAASYVERSS